MEVYGKKYDAQGNSFDGWHNKKSTFFPDSWSPEKIQAEIAHGFQNKQFVRSQNNGADIFHGTMTDGTTVEFAIKNNVIESAYPNLNP
ncbi:MAG: EndoU domain-containing protein [Phaeodactylibacter sp.]|nr:EndoU domain-containing protein [Phaeodactylibacter sp.]